MDALPAAAELRILAIDIGGTGLKATVLDAEGNLLTERVRVKTPPLCGRDALIEGILALVAPLEKLAYNRIAIGFPGVVRHGVILTAPNLDAQELPGLALADTLAKRLGHPARLLNDADLQGLAVIRGRGTEMVITLGTGLGSALFADGKLGPHLELSQHPFRKGETYNQQLGNATFKEIGAEKWNSRVRKAIANFRVLTTFDRLYIGGGNAKALNFKLPPDVEIVDNQNGLKGGAWLWRFEEAPQ